MISVVIAGRPYAIPEIAQDSDALLYAFYPGPMGGKAIAELLSGKYAPSGRLPVSLPRNCGQLPVYYNHTVSYPAMRYCDMEQELCIHLGKEWDIPTWSIWISVLKAAGCVDYFRNCKE